MRKVVFLAALLMGFAFTSCVQDDADIWDSPNVTAPSNGGDEDEDDPVPPGGGRANIEDAN